MAVIYPLPVPEPLSTTLPLSAEGGGWSRWLLGFCIIAPLGEAGSYSERSVRGSVTQPQGQEEEEAPRSPGQSQSHWREPPPKPSLPYDSELAHPDMLSCRALSKQLQGGSLMESRPPRLSLLCLHPLRKQGDTLTLSCPDLQPYTGCREPADQLIESSKHILPLKCLYVVLHTQGSKVKSVSHSCLLSIRTSRTKSQV